ncbi:unnamed protein product [Lathyrus sativus]|nr:unnamed protein product [Lathyrus sativus]
MIKDAIVSLKEKNGSSQYAFAEFIEEKQKQFPAKLLLQNWKKKIAYGKLIKVKGLFKLSAAAKKLAVAKPKTKPAAKAKAVKARLAAKPKAKAVVKPKGTPQSHFLCITKKAFSSSCTSQYTCFLNNRT